MTLEEEKKALKAGLTVCRRTIIEIDHEITGESMRSRREQMGLSLREVAKRMGISAAYLSDLERGRRHWSIELGVAFKEALEEGGE